ncbi:F-box/LRR-repeat protein 20-like [Hydra vulgaris]|uniref:F-box/LRR-repeat protein 20-like n=1 Tax=Hydra vulgaris TaxID=6087 RepID=UPI0001927109|nr:F-box/LRR-repeat protein 20-like [Hydra vulgaris]
MTKENNLKMSENISKYEKNSLDISKILTDECILRLFAFLDLKTLSSVNQMCRRWYYISKDKSLWRSVDFSPYKITFEEPAFENFTKKNLKDTIKLNLGSLYVTSKMLRSIADNCHKLSILLFGRSCVAEIKKRRRKSFFAKNLQTLDLRSSLGSFEFLVDVDQKFPNITNIGIGPRSFGRYKLPYIFSKLTNVRIIDFTNCLEIDDNGINVLATNCQKIESICLIGCRHVYGKSFACLLRNCQNLKTLLIRYLKINDDIFAQKIWDGCVIEELDLSACPRITWQGLFALLAQLKHVHYLNLSYCGEGRAVNDIVLSQMVNSGMSTKLRMVDLRWSFHISPNALGNFLTKCKHLEKFGIYQSFQITADNIADFLIHLPSIKILEFGGSYQQELNRSHLIPMLLKTAKNLEVLSLINFTSTNLIEDYKNIKTLITTKSKLTRINFCDSSPELVKIAKEIAQGVKQIKITVKWECALPPPVITLDSILNI